MITFQTAQLAHDAMSEIAFELLHESDPYPEINIDHYEDDCNRIADILPFDLNAIDHLFTTFICTRYNLRSSDLFDN